MSENTTPARCTASEWAAARSAGLLTAQPLSTAQEVALHKFATEIRRDLLDALQEISDYAKRDGDIIAAHLGGISSAAIAKATGASNGN